SEEHSAQKFEDLAGSFDHLLLLRRGIEEFDSVGKAVPIADNAAHDELRPVVGNHQFQRYACAEREFSGQKQAHAPAADVRGLSAKAVALTLEKHRDIHGNDDGLALPSALVFGA